MLGPVATYHAAADAVRQQLALWASKVRADDPAATAKQATLDELLAQVEMLAAAFEPGTAEHCLLESFRQLQQVKQLHPEVTQAVWKIEFAPGGFPLLHHVHYE